MKVVLVTGGFDPIHSGHLAYFQAAKSLGDILVVGLNSDDWLTRKKGKPFMEWFERSKIIQHLDMVDYVIEFNDEDNSCRSAIKLAKQTWPDTDIIFANGGDRDKDNIPEMDVEGVEFAFGVGGSHKMNSSSWILKDWNQPTTERAWGSYTVLDQGYGWLTKKLTFHEGKSLSDQRHNNRSEHWHVVRGRIEMRLQHLNGMYSTHYLDAGQSINIPAGVWHKATNIGEGQASIIEVWLGIKLSEDDIERRD
jgi:D-beta-D-heptose 7-phosphate kinase/D-beta-D-heptose 1-phosphate adenosyltransferase